MLHIILDRFIEIYSNIKYPLFMTHKRLLALIATNWSLSVLIAIIDTALEAATKSLLIYRVNCVLLLVLDLTILISAITTYIYFYNKAYSIRRLEVNSLGQPEESRLNLLRQKFKQPCYIVMTYIYFNLTGTMLVITSDYVQNVRKSRILFTSFEVLLIVGLTSDAIIYVFANKNVYRLLCSIFRKQRSSRVGDIEL